MMSEIDLPFGYVSDKIVNPRRLVIYSKPKSGKTTLFSKLENSLLVDLEEGSDYVEGYKVKANSLEELSGILSSVIKAGKPYKYGIIDTVTALEDIVLPLATKLYRSTPMGKSFGLLSDGTYDPKSNVLTLPKGAGYMYLRQAFFNVIGGIEKAFEYTIYAGHLKDASIDDETNQVIAANIDLTGKLKTLLCSTCDTIGYLYRKGNETHITFETSDMIACGSRSPHLKNQDIIVGEEIDGEYVAYWDRIYK